jgi:hypothetical protein
MTDQANYYRNFGPANFADYQAVDHSREEWIRGEAHTNTIEGYFSLFKHSMKGLYQHCSEKHLHRYLAATTRAAGFASTIRCAPKKRQKGIVGKRLTYQRPNREEAPVQKPRTVRYWQPRKPLTPANRPARI